MDQFLESLPVSSVGQKHTALFECDIDDDANRLKVGGPSLSLSLPLSCNTAHVSRRMLISHLIPRRQLIWLKLVRRSESASAVQVGQSNQTATASGEPADRQRTSPNSNSLDNNDITLLSLNKRLITPDKRFHVRHQPPNKWLLQVDNVGAQDDRAYYLCQVSGGGGGSPSAKSAGGQQSAVGNSNRNNYATPSGRFVGGARLNVLGEYRSVSGAWVSGD